MSLLMDALKKAEEAKRAAGEGRTADTQALRELELAPLETRPADAPSDHSPRQPSSGVSPLPDLSLHIESVDADLAAVSTGSTHKPRAARSTPAAANSATPKATNHLPRDDSERAAVRNVFSAKQTTERRSALWFILPVAAVVAAGIGTYFWWQLQAVSRGSLAQPVPMAAQSVPTPVTTPTPIEPPTAATPAANEPVTVETASPLPEPIPATPPASSNTTVKTLATPATTRSRADRPAPGTQTPAAPTTAPDGALHLTRSQPKQNLTLEQAYDALQAGQLDVAQRAYQQLLRGDPKSTDALLGLATIAARRGDAGRAHSYYLLALESNPNDPTAQAGVIQTRGQSDPAQSESRLKTALSSQPDSPALLFALGNLYAREQRWGEAQQAYFRAYSTEPDNADFIFNLAVSLDQLHQDKLAAQYYQMALNAAESAGNTHAGFDRSQVQKRIQELLP
ncbi:MAG: tetratricopeptide repeat protein [Propionivibrio sp.]|nr:tetratricopeptide repeat protein [Propionivibrio sp.]